MKNEASIWFPYHIKDFRSECYSLSFELKGIYVTLLERLWEEGGYLSADDPTLAAEIGLTEKEWKKVKARILRSFEIVDGQVTHPRFLVELAKANANIEQKRRAGIASAKARWGEKDGNGRLTGVERALNGRGNGSVTGGITEEQRLGNGGGNGSVAARQPCAGGGGGEVVEIPSQRVDELIDNLGDVIPMRVRGEK